MSTISSGMSSTGGVQWGAPPRPPKGAGGPGGPEGAQGAQGSGEGPPSLSDLFAQIDTDSDGSLSATELKSALESQGSGSSTAASSEAASSEASANSMSGFGMDTQGFAGMMGGMPPPPPPPAQGGSSSSDDQAQQDLFSAIDSNGDGGLSQDEVKGFEEKMRALFEQMQQMGAGGTGSASSGAGAGTMSGTTSGTSAVSLLA